MSKIFYNKGSLELSSKMTIVDGHFKFHGLYSAYRVPFGVHTLEAYEDGICRVSEQTAGTDSVRSFYNDNGTVYREEERFKGELIRKVEYSTDEHGEKITKETIIEAKESRPIVCRQIEKGEAYKKLLSDGRFQYEKDRQIETDVKRANIADGIYIGLDSRGRLVNWTLYSDGYCLGSFTGQERKCEAKNRLFWKKADPNRRVAIASLRSTTNRQERLAAIQKYRQHD